MQMLVLAVFQANVLTVSQPMKHEHPQLAAMALSAPPVGHGRNSVVNDMAPRHCSGGFARLVLVHPPCFCQGSLGIILPKCFFVSYIMPFTAHRVPAVNPP
jgi:hypothetical protein